MAPAAARGAKVRIASHMKLICPQCPMQVIKLSDAVQPLPREVTCCVHGAAPGFVTAGAAKTHAPDGSGRRFSKGAYCLAKVVWGKGW